MHVCLLETLKIDSSPLPNCHHLSDKSLRSSNDGQKEGFLRCRNEISLPLDVYKSDLSWSLLALLQICKVILRGKGCPGAKRAAGYV